MILDAVRKAINELVISNSDITVRGAEKLLSESLGVRIVFYPLQERGKPRRITGHKHLSKILGKSFAVQLEVEIAPDAPELKPLQLKKLRKYESLQKKYVEGATSLLDSIDPLLERFITAVANLEKRRDFVWAGFVVKDLLPGMGLDIREAQTRFDRWIDQEILVREKRANPNNPDYPSTCVKLNREHDLVKIALNLNGSSTKPFVPVPIRGEPASTTLIRDR